MSTVAVLVYDAGRLRCNHTPSSRFTSISDLQFIEHVKLKTSWNKKIEVKCRFNPSHIMSHHDRRVKGLHGPASLFAPHPEF